MKPVNIHEAKTQLSRLLQRAQNGEEVVIAKAGNPIARLVRYEPEDSRVAAPGAMRDEGWIADNFDEPLDKFFEVLRSSRP